MALTFGIAPATIGPGMRLVVHVPFGPIPLDDYIQVTLQRSSDGEGFTYGTKRTNGDLLVYVTLGWDERQDLIVNGFLGGMAAGTPMSVYAQQTHGNFTFVDDSAVTPYGTLDLLSYPWALGRHAHGGVSADIAAIKAAVLRQFPTS